MCAVTPRVPGVGPCGWPSLCQTRAAAAFWRIEQPGLVVMGVADPSAAAVKLLVVPALSPHGIHWLAPDGTAVIKKTL